jgi:hypothetical protein
VFSRPRYVYQGLHVSLALSISQDFADSFSLRRQLLNVEGH